MQISLGKSRLIREPAANNCAKGMRNFSSIDIHPASDAGNAIVIPDMGNPGEHLHLDGNQKR